MKTSSDDVSAIDAAVPEAPDVARTIAYRRSLRTSRMRRTAARLRRRRVLRSRGSVVLASAGLLLAGGGAFAAQGGISGGGSGAGLSGDAIVAAQRALGVQADGVVGPRTRGATKRFQRKQGLTVDGVIGPQTLAALGVEAGAVVVGARAVGAPVGDPVLARIAACESGGDPAAVSADGLYRGKYQFSRPTWKQMGGAGDPAQAAEAVQDRLAAKLLRQAGTAPWPNCG